MILVNHCEGNLTLGHICPSMIRLRERIIPLHFIRPYLEYWVQFGPPVTHHKTHGNKPEGIQRSISNTISGLINTANDSRLRKLLGCVLFFLLHFVLLLFFCFPGQSKQRGHLLPKKHTKKPRADPCHRGTMKQQNQTVTSHSLFKTLLGLYEKILPHKKQLNIRGGGKTAWGSSILEDFPNWTKLCATEDNPDLCKRLNKMTSRNPIHVIIFFPRIPGNQWLYKTVKVIKGNIKNQQLNCTNKKNIESGCIAFLALQHCSTKLFPLGCTKEMSIEYLIYCL